MNITHSEKSDECLKCFVAVWFGGRIEKSRYTRKELNGAESDEGLV